jgi:hypothetical protein
MASQTEIMNLALFKLAQSIGIPSLDDDSKAADVMRQLWPTIRDLVLTDRVWPWALQSKPLQMVVEPAQPGWTYRYAYPADCVTAYAVTTADGIRAAGKLQKFAAADYVASVWGSGCFDYETAYGEQATTISTNVEGALLVYAVRVEDAGRYPPQFVNALACRLAAEAAPPLIGEVGLQNKAQLLQEYQLALTHAGAHASNESASMESYVTPSMAARL